MGAGISARRRQAEHGVSQKTKDDKMKPPTAVDIVDTKETSHNDIELENIDFLLMPGLPNETSLRCISRVPLEDRWSLLQVSKSWRHAISSGEVNKVDVQSFSYSWTTTFTFSFCVYFSDQESSQTFREMLHFFLHPICRL